MNRGYACVVCDEYADHGVISFGSSIRGGEGEWRQQKEQDDHQLCMACFGRLSNRLARAGESRPAASSVALMPGFNACDFCITPLGGISYTVELIPFAPAFPSRARQSRVVHLRQHRLCMLCVIWARGIVAVSRGRSGPVAPSLPIAIPAIEVATVDLDPGSTALIRQLIMSTGGMFVTAEEMTDGVVFLPASRHRLASQVPTSTTHPQVAIVAGRFRAGRSHPDLRRLLPIHTAAGPLSRENVAGTIDRVLSNDVRAVHKVTGQMFWRITEGRFGQPANVFRIDTTPERRAGFGWACRRVLRGYDRIGLDDDGNLQAIVYCPEPAAENVAARLQFMLGAWATVEHVASLPASDAGVLPGGSIIRDPARPRSSPMRFVSQALANASLAEDSRQQAQRRGA